LIQLPRLLDSSLKEVKRLRPVQMSVNLEIVPLSTASMTLLKDDTVTARSFVEIYTSIGSVGIFRVRAPQESYGDETITVECEHAITEVADYLIKEDYEKAMNAQTAMKTLFSHYKGKLWKLGSLTNLSGTVNVIASYNTVLEAMLAILDQQRDLMMTFDFTTSPWTINFTKKGTVVAAEGRLSRNVKSAKVTYDDSNLCTRVYADGLTGTKDNVYGHIDASTLSKYGVVEKTVSGSDNKDDTTRAAKAFLNDNKEPKVSVEIDAADLSLITGEPLDTFELGKLCRLALPDDDVTIEQHITSLSWDDVFNNEESIHVTLAAKKDTVLSFLHDVETSGGRGGGSASRKTDKNKKEYTTKFEQTDRSIEMVATRTDKNDKILEQAGLSLNSKGVLTYATDSKLNIGSRFQVQADQITSLVEKTGVNKLGKKETLYSKVTQTESSISSVVSKTGVNKLGKNQTLYSQIQQNANAIKLTVKKGDVISSINQTAESIKIKASKIELDGNVVASAISATGVVITMARMQNAYVEEFTQGFDVSGNITCDNLNTSTISCGSIDGSTITGTGFKIDGNSNTAKWQSKTVVTEVKRSSSRQFVYAVNGSTSNLATTTGTIVTGVTTETIYYLGHT
jgi:phage minor structural protein